MKTPLNYKSSGERFYRIHHPGVEEPFLAQRYGKFTVLGPEQGVLGSLDLLLVRLM